MKKQIFLYAGGLLILAACNGKKTTTEVVVVTDTIVKEVTAPVDTAAITAQYEAEKAKTKGTYVAPHKKQGTKKVYIDSDPTIESYNAEKPAATADPKVKVIHDVEYVYFAPSERAKFPGGEKAFDNYLVKNLTYPEKALDRHIEGTVYAEVFLDEEGNVTKVESAGKRIGYGLEEEAIRILESSPRWMPARDAGKAVKSKLTIPISFKIDD
jgi:periplasmic protein TonB